QRAFCHPRMELSWRAPSKREGQPKSPPAAKAVGLLAIQGDEALKCQTPGLLWMTRDQSRSRSSQGELLCGEHLASTVVAEEARNGTRSPRDPGEMFAEFRSAVAPLQSE